MLYTHAVYGRSLWLCDFLRVHTCIFMCFYLHEIAFNCSDRIHDRTRLQSRRVHWRFRNWASIVKPKWTSEGKTLDSHFIFSARAFAHWEIYISTKSIVSITALHIYSCNSFTTGFALNFNAAIFPLFSSGSIASLQRKLNAIRACWAFILWIYSTCVCVSTCAIYAHRNVQWM